MSYQPIKALIDHFEAFESSTGQTDLGQFASWLNNTLNGPQAEEAVEQKAKVYSNPLASCLITLGTTLKS